jgi:hypothetical protein
MSRTQAVRVGLAALSLLLLAGLAMASIVWAGSSANYAVDWSVMSGGGAPVAGGAVTLNGTLGQTAIGPSAATHGSLGAGFWYGLGAGIYEVYLPLVLRNY